MLYGNYCYIIIEDVPRRYSPCSALQCKKVQSSIEKFYWSTKLRKTEGGGRKFKRPHLERPIFRNLKIANVKSYEVQLFDFFFTKLF